MKTTEDRTKKMLLAAFHGLCARAGMQDYEKKSIIEGFGRLSSADLTIEELQQACKAIEARIEPTSVQMDLWRKRLMASIGGWLSTIGKPQSAAQIKAIACRASGYDNFNHIPFDRLRSLYNAFKGRQRDWRAVGDLAKMEMDILSSLN